MNENLDGKVSETSAYNCAYCGEFPALGESLPDSLPESLSGTLPEGFSEGYLKGIGKGAGNPWPKACMGCHQKGLERRRARRLEGVKAALAEAQVPPRFQQQGVVLPADIKTRLRPGLGLYLYGPVGVGKSMAMGALVEENIKVLAENPGNPYLDKVPKKWVWVDFLNFIMRLQDTYMSKSSAYKMLEEVLSAPNLVIDDLGAEKPTEYTIQATYLIYDHREKWMLPTFTTSNLALDELEERYGCRISDRIALTSVVVEIKGESKRLNKNQRGKTK